MSMLARAGLVREQRQPLWTRRCEMGMEMGRVRMEARNRVGPSAEGAGPEDPWNRSREEEVRVQVGVRVQGGA